MTLREVSIDGGISSTTVQINEVDPQKAKTSRRRRMEIQRLKTTYQQNGVVTNDTCERMQEEEGSACKAHGWVSVMGRRREMEDAVRVEKDFVENNNVVQKKYDYFGVYDGHGGSHVVEACKDRMHAILLEEIERWDYKWGDNKLRNDNCHLPSSPTWGNNSDNSNNSKEGNEGLVASVDWEMVLGKCFERMDEEVGKGKDDVEEMTVGSTVVVAIVGKEEVVVANCGDSRAVICRDGVAVPLSVDHKPDRPDELARIEAAGGRVINWNGHRVLGVLATSRSIGDYYLKPYVSPLPEINISKRTEADEFLILASDGLWDVISNEVACQVVRRCLAGRIKSQEMFKKISRISSNRAEVAAVLLTELAISKGSKDNISVIVVEL